MEKNDIKTTKLTLPGYTLTERLYDGTRTSIYRGNRKADNLPVVVKFLKNEYPTFHELVQFRNQYTIAKNLSLDGIIHPYSLEKYHNGFVLIMEDVGSLSLHDYTQSKPLSLPAFFHIAIAVVKTLEGLYQNRVIHKDIKPQNILIHPESNQIKLIDFSIASLLPRETQEIQSINVLEGTLAYLSPEQTGRMNRGIDYRTDFYSLGVTFYELLTGQLPFQSDDPMELIHCHIAQTPVPPIKLNSAIPSLINGLILKLMAKTAEGRYQSAFGLRYDLEQCQQQWEANGHISSFALGQRDISDRFQIPEKLYGRENEVATLLAAFDRVSEGNTEMMLVAGFSGIGKTVLVNEVHKPIVRQRGYFIKGKFDQFKRNIPFSAFVQAFQTLMRQILTENAEQIQAWKNQILEALGENGQIIIEVIPELEHIIGPQPPVPELIGSAGQNRFNRFFQKFIHVFTSAEHPLVIFLDDLQWIDSASLKLLQLLVTEAHSTYLLLIGAYRDNEVSPTHPLMLTLDEIQQTKSIVNQITLGPLDQIHLNRLIADAMSCPLKSALPLTELVMSKTKGNPFFTIQFLKSLHEEDLITFDFSCNCWQCDVAAVRALAITDDVVEFMAIQLQKLPHNTQTILKLAACIGNQFDLATLATVSEQSTTETATNLWKALQEGLVIPITDIYKFFQDTEDLQVAKPTEELDELSVPYKFLHDRVQQAAYSLIAEAKKPSVHLKIGQLLKSHTRSEEELDEQIFDIINQLNQGVVLLTTQTERDELVLLNLKAARKARASTAYAAASRYLTVGLELLSADSWQNQYDLTLTLHELATEIAYLNGDFDRQAQLAENILKHARTLLDQVKNYEIQIQVYLSQYQQRKSLETAQFILKQLVGIEFPNPPTQKDIEVYLQKTQSVWEGKSIESLIDLPVMTDKNQKAAMRIFSLLTGAAFEVDPNFFMLMVCKQVQLSITYGNVPESAIGYVTYGMIQAGLGNIETAYQFGQLALSILEKFNAKQHKSNVLTPDMTFLVHRKFHFRETLKPLLESYQSGLEVGELEFSGYGAMQYCFHSYYCGRELTALQSEMASYSEAFRQVNQEISFRYNEIYRQAVLNLLGQSEDPCRLIGEAFDEDEILPICQQNNEMNVMYFSYVHKISLPYFFQDYHQTIENATFAEPYIAAMAIFGGTPLIYMCESLARLAVYSEISAEEQQSFLEKVRTNQEKLQEWAKHAPMNHLHKFNLVEADLHRVLGNHVDAMEFYDRAIAGAKENEFLHEEALANEVAARFYLEWGKEKIAKTYLTEAYYGYARWGAKAKVDDLEKRYPELLAPIFTHETTPFQTETITKTITQTISHIPMPQGTVAITGTSTGTSFLDLATVMKASQTISDEMVFEQLLEKMMRIVIENAGAKRGILLLEKQEQFWLEAEAQVEEECKVTLCSIPLEQATQELLVSAAVINTVVRNKAPLVLHDATQEESLANDRYLIEKQPKSVLGQPILYHGQLTGVLYLENNLMSNAFTTDRLTVLKLLATQIAISLENAQTMAHLDAKVAERTAQLNTKVEELTHTRHELVQSEKMASLGRLVAGFAHELNTPIGVAVGTASTLQESTKAINHLLEQEEVDEEELVSTLESINETADLTLSNIERAAELVTSFKRTAVDQTSEDVRQFEVKMAISDVINTLQNRFKQTDIEIQVDCPVDMIVYTLPGALEQLLTNFMMNSLIHGFDEGKNTGLIKIMVRLVENSLHLEYSDTGKGITPENLEKIFEPFFTTHRAHGGTGLGLYICYNIVTTQLQGTMTCDSTPGNGIQFVIDFPVETVFVENE